MITGVSGSLGVSAFVFVLAARWGVLELMCRGWE